MFCSKITAVWTRRQMQRNSSLLIQKILQWVSSLILRLYATLREEKQLTSSGCSRYNVWAGIQRVIILFSVQYWLNLGIAQLPWPLRISRRQALDIRDAVYLLKCFSHLKPNLLVVQPLSLIAITQLVGRLRYQLT